MRARGHVIPLLAALGAAAALRDVEVGLDGAVRAPVAARRRLADLSIDVCSGAVGLGGTTTGFVASTTTVPGSTANALTQAFSGEALSYRDFGPSAPASGETCYMYHTADLCTSTSSTTAVAETLSATFAAGAYSHVRFSYHLNGQHRQSFALAYQDQGSGSFVDLWSASGSFGDKWYTSGDVQLPATAVQLRFRVFNDDMQESEFCKGGTFYQCTPSSIFVRVGDLVCQTDSNNHPDCDWDGGDCCTSSCEDGGDATKCLVFDCLDPAATENGGTGIKPASHAVAIGAVTLVDGGGYACEAESSPLGGTTCPSRNLQSTSSYSDLLFLIDPALEEDGKAVVANQVDASGASGSGYRTEFLQEGWGNPPSLGNETRASDGVTQRYFEFDGTQYLPTDFTIYNPASVGDAPFSLATNFTVAFWVYVDAALAQAGEPRKFESIFSHGFVTDLAEYSGFSIFMTPQWTFDIDFRLEAASIDNNRLSFIPSPSTAQSKWYFITMGTDSAGEIKCCIDSTCGTVNNGKGTEIKYLDYRPITVGGVSISQALNARQTPSVYDARGLEGRIGMVAAYNYYMSNDDVLEVFDATRSIFCECRAGYVCTACAEVACPPGFYCPGDYTAQSCGSPAVYCPGGSSQVAPTAVSTGYYTTPEGSTEATAQAPCEPGFFCSAGVKAQCGSVTVYCPAESSAPLSVDLGSYGVGPAVEEQFTQAICPKGTYCVGGVSTPCPEGTYGSVEGLTGAACSGPCSAGFICAEGSTSSQQEPCSADKVDPANWYCPEGSSEAQMVPAGAFSTPLSAPETERTGFSSCSVDQFCSAGVATPKLSWSSSSCESGGTAAASFSENLDGAFIGDFGVTSISGSNLSYIITAAYVPASLCPDGFTALPVADADGQCLRAAAQAAGARTVASGQAACAALDGARLALPKSSAENANLFTVASAVSADGNFYIAPADEAVEGTFVDYVSGIPIFFEGWAAGQPSDGVNEGAQDCAAMNNSAGGAWTNVECSGVDYDALCEWVMYTIDEDGMLYLNGPGLDFETFGNTTLTVYAEDTAGASTSCTVTISLIDENDPPVIDTGSGVRNVSERSPVNTALGDPILATDPDAFDELFFEITGGNELGFFDIGFCTGSITVAKEGLDFDEHGPFNITVKVSDDGTPQRNDTAFVIINVVDINDPPQFNVTDPVMTVSENDAGAVLNGTWCCAPACPGVSCNVLPVRDDDAGETFEWKITRNDGPGELSEIFEIDDATGIIKLLAGEAIDYETDPSYSIDVRVLDSGNAEDVITVTINAIDENDPPSITFFGPATVSEDALSGDTADMSFLISDEDVSLTNVDTVFPGFSLAVSRCFEDGALLSPCPFTIDAGAPEVLEFIGAPGTLNHEVQDTYLVEVAVTDDGLVRGGAFKGQLTSYTNLTVLIGDVNEPPIVEFTAISVYENVSQNSIIGAIIYSDPDDTTSLPQFSMLNGTDVVDFPDRFTNSISNVITFDFETGPTTYLYEVQVNDGDPSDPQTGSATLQVNILDANDAPVFAQTGYTFSFTENVLGRAAFANASVVCTDEDSGATSWGTISFAFSGAGVAGTYATVEASTGFMNTVTAVNFEEVASPLTGTVSCSDGGGLSADPSATLTINLVDANDAPVLAAASFAVPESLAYTRDEPVGFIPGSDEDTPLHPSGPWGTLTYTLVSDSSPGDIFLLDAGTGELFIKVGSAFTSVDGSFTVRVRVEDGEGLFDEEDYVISAVQGNLRPAINPQNIDVPENTAGELGIVQAFDSDIEQWLAFSVVGCAYDGTANCISFFDVSAISESRYPDAGDLSDPFNASVTTSLAAGFLNYEGDFWTSDTRVVNLTVLVRDVNTTANESLTASTLVTLTCVDVPEAPVWQEERVFTIAEGNTAGTVLGTLAGAATDEDAGSSVTYALVDSSAEISVASDGQVTMDVDIDFEAVSGSLQLAVRATDNTGLSSVSTFRVFVTDVNEAPTVLDASATIDENVVNGARGGDVTTVQGSDPDTGESSQLVYSIVDDPSGRFGIEASTGLLYALVSLDFEERRSYSVQVNVTDPEGLTDTATISIDVVDLEDMVVNTITPSVLQTVGGETITFEGTNLGAQDSSLAGGTVVELYYFSPVLGTSYNATAADCFVAQPYTRVSCTVPSGGGASYDLVLSVTPPGTITSRLAISAALAYAAPSVTGITRAASQPTAGGQSVTIEGANFGPNGNTDVAVSPTSTVPGVRVTYANGADTYACASPVVTPFGTSAQRIVCQTAPGIGADFNWTLSVFGQTLEVPRSVDVFSYSAPAISGILLGGAAATVMTTQGGETLQISGENFGTNALGDPTVTYESASRSYTAACTSSSVTSAHATITCLTVPGVGAGFEVFVTVGAQKSAASASVFRYATPVIAPLTDGAPAISGAGAEEAQTRGNQLLIIDGREFGPFVANGGAAPIVTYGATGDEITAEACFVSSEYQQIRCLTAPGTGRDLFVKVYVADQVSNLYGNLSYGAPVVASYDAQWDPDTGRDGGDTEGGEWVILNGDNFGTAAMQTLETVTYGPTGTEYVACNATSYLTPGRLNAPSMMPSEAPSAVLFAPTTAAATPEPTPDLCYCEIVTPHTQINCSTIPGSGFGHTWLVTVNGQLSTVPTTKYASPVISAIGGPGAADASTAGGQAVTIDGRFFGPDGDLQFVKTGPSGEDFTVDGCTRVSHERIVCSTLPSLGAEYFWTVGVGGQVSADKSISTGYAAPRAYTIGPQLLNTAGGDTLTITGADFGVQVPSAGIEVLFDGEPITVDAPGGNVPIIFPDEQSVYSALVGGNDTLFVSAPEMVDDRHSRNVTVRSFLRSYRASTTQVSGVVAFEYRGPNVTDLQNAVGPEISAGGGATLETTDLVLLGSGFGTAAFGRVLINGVTCAAIGGTYGSSGSCRATSWSHNRVTVNYVGRTGNVTVALGEKASAPFEFFQFSPVLFATDTRFLPDDDGYPTRGTPGEVRLAGLNFGTDLDEISITVGGVPAVIDEVYGIQTESSVAGYTGSEVVRSVEFFVPPGSGEDNLVVLTRGTLTSFSGNNDALVLLDYVPPEITGFSPSTISTQGGDVVTIIGTNFGDDESVISVFFGGAGGESLTVVPGSASHESVQVLSPEGSGACFAVAIVVAGQMDETACPDLGLTFAEPDFFFGFGLNGTEGAFTVPEIPTVGGDFSIQGENFGPPGTLAVAFQRGDGGSRRLLAGVDLPPFSAEVRDDPEQNHTFASIAIGPGQGNNSLVLSASGRNLTIPLNYQSPELDSVVPDSGPTDGGTVVTIRGRNFGIYDVADGVAARNFQLRFGNFLVQDILSYAQDEIVFRSPEGEGVDPVPITLQVEGVRSSGDTTFTYQSPVATSLMKTNELNIYDDPILLGSDCTPFSAAGCGLTTDGGYLVGINGSNFGLSKPIILINGLEADNVTLVSHSAVTFLIPPGVGVGIPVVLRKGTYESDPLLFDYDPPWISDISPNEPNAIGETIEIDGRNFGPSSNLAGAVEIFVGETVCGQVQVGDFTKPIYTQEEDRTYLWCQLPRMKVGPRAVNLTIAGRTIFYQEEESLVTPECKAGYYGQEAWKPTLALDRTCTLCNAEQERCMMLYDEVRQEYRDQNCVFELPCVTVPGTRLASNNSANCTAITREDEFCLECPVGTVCPAAISDDFPVEPIAEEGYWLEDVPGLDAGVCGEDRKHRPICYNVQPCEPREACLGNNECKKGYTGIKCAECCDANHGYRTNSQTGVRERDPFCWIGNTRLEYYRFGGECVECPENPLALLIMFVVGVLIISTGAYFLHKKRVNMGILSIGIDYFQVLAIFATTRVQWPAEIEQLFIAFSVFNINLNITAPECIFTIDYRTKWIIIQFTPVIILGVFFTLHCAKVFQKFFIKRVHGRRLWSHTHTMVGLSLISMYYLYLFITANTLEIFNCIEIISEDGVSDGKRYLASAPSEECYQEGSLQQELLPAAIIWFIVYGVGYPALVAYLLLKPDHALMIKEDQLLRAMGKGDLRVTNPHCYEFRKRYSRLYYEFKPQYWWWKLLILMRKLGIVVFALVFRTNPTFQMCMILLVIFASYAMQVRHSPYMSMSERDEVLILYADDVAFIRDAADKTAADEVAKRRPRTGQQLHLGRGNVPRPKIKEAPLTAGALAAASANYFWNWNTVEAILLICAVLVNLFGIMFESQYLRDGSSDLEILTWTCLLVISFSLLYYGIVVWTEIVAVIFPELACPFLNTEVHGEEEDDSVNEHDFEMHENELLGERHEAPAVLTHAEQQPGTMNMAIDEYYNLKQSVKKLTQENLESKKLIKSLTMQSTVGQAPTRQRSKFRDFGRGQRADVTMESRDMDAVNEGQGAEEL